MFYYVDDVHSFGILTVSHFKYFAFYCLYFSHEAVSLLACVSHLCLLGLAHSIHALFHPKLFPYLCPFFSPIFSVWKNNNNMDFINTEIPIKNAKHRKTKSDILKARLLLLSVHKKLSFKRMLIGFKYWDTK